MEKLPKDTGTIAVCALRYCVGRRTYMPSLVIDWVKANWEFLSVADRQVIYHDTRKAIASGLSLGHDCDRDTWLEFQVWLNNQQV